MAQSDLNFKGLPLATILRIDCRGTKVEAIRRLLQESGRDITEAPSRLVAMEVASLSSRKNGVAIKMEMAVRGAGL